MTSSDQMTGSDVIREVNFFSSQIRSYYISLERKFNADENSYKKHGLKMNCSEYMVAEVTLYNPPIKINKHNFSKEGIKGLIFCILANF